ncbi:hypothetical protein MSPP1_003712 [Malassezia sp. CBS 17886]|nr:hypothetical protein MSPP1_003712 [Malassezia sp. CBS 17886]
MARQWGPVAHCAFGRDTEQGRLLNYGTVTFEDPESVARVLHASQRRHGEMRIPFGTPPRAGGAENAYAGWEDIERALATAPSLKDAVSEAAPLARGSSVRSSPADYFSAKVERRSMPLRADHRGPTHQRSARLLRELEQFDGFAGGLQKSAADYRRRRRGDKG